MDETRIIRGRHVVFQRREPVATFALSLDVFDAGDNLIEVLGRLADLSALRDRDQPTARGTACSAHKM